MHITKSVSMCTDAAGMVFALPHLRLCTCPIYIMFVILAMRRCSCAGSSACNLIIKLNACQATVERLEAQAEEAGAHKRVDSHAPTRRKPLLQRATEPTLEARLLRAVLVPTGGAAGECAPEALQAPRAVDLACEARR